MVPPHLPHGVAPPSIPASPWFAIEEHLCHLSHLGANWDGLGAEPPSVEAIDKARTWAELLDRFGCLPPVRVQAGLSRNIWFLWEGAKCDYREMVFEADGSARAIVVPRQGHVWRSGEL